MNHLKTKISYFKNLFSTDPTTIPLDQWIDLCSKESEYSKIVEDYRKTGNKDLKLNLPLITPGGVMIDGRKRENVKERTGWIAFDIDQKDNLQVTDWEKAKDKIGRIVYVAYCGLTASAQGLWGLILVANPKRQAEYFEQLKADFSNYGFQLDPSKGANPNDARFYSFDPKPYVNEDFQVYNRLPQIVIKFKKRSFSSKSRSREKNLVEKKLNKITQQRINLAPNYDTYLKIGFAFSNEFGEEGREYFHAAICHSPKYKRRNADKQYTNCVRSSGYGITIATFYHFCKINNI